MKQIINENFKCNECGLIYKDRKWAEKCEKFCRTNKACSLKITKHSINKKEND